MAVWLVWSGVLSAIIYSDCHERGHECHGDTTLSIVLVILIGLAVISIPLLQCVSLLFSSLFTLQTVATQLNHFDVSHSFNSSL